MTFRAQLLRPLARRSFPLVALFALAASAQELPVQRVVIYKNGVAYVERAGAVSGASSISLSFRAEEMTDILKSLSISSEGGAVERVRFSTDESLDEKLRPFPSAFSQVAASRPCSTPFVERAFRRREGLKPSLALSSPPRKCQLPPSSRRAISLPFWKTTVPSTRLRYSR